MLLTVDVTLYFFCSFFLFIGGLTVRCPKCEVGGGRKDDECMHMTCSSCQTQWCYVCGQATDKCQRNRGCDANSVYLHRQPGWGNFGRGAETPAHGALIEFHRRKMAFLVRQAQAKLEPEASATDLWTRLRCAHPCLLDDVLEGRSITWEEVATAELPLFGARRQQAAVTLETGRAAEATAQPAVSGHTGPTHVGVGMCVRVTTDVAQLELQSEGHGGWTEAMASYCGALGRVIAIYPSGDLEVHFSEFSPQLTGQWTLNPASVSLEADTTGRHADTDHERASGQADIAVNSIVRVTADAVELERMSEGHGGWNPDMRAYCGANGRVISISASGDPLVAFAEFTSTLTRQWRLNPRTITVLTEVHPPEPANEAVPEGVDGLFCPSGHALTRFRTPHAHFRCDTCAPERSAMRQGVWLMSCRACNYDICDRCCNGPLLPDIIPTSAPLTQV